MHLRIAICDDSVEDAQFLQNILNKWAVECKINTQVEVYPSAEAFLFHYAEDKSFDILLLDIEMRGMDGVTLAKQIRQQNKTVQIVFITGFEDYISEGYEVAALHYLLKPVKTEKLYEVMDRAIEAIKREERAILLSVGGEILRIPISQIQYVEIFSHVLSIVMLERIVQVKIPISEMERMLDESFVRCHRSYLVGLRYVSHISKTEVFLDNGKVLPLSRSAAPIMHKAFISYYTGGRNEII